MILNNILNIFTIMIAFITNFHICIQEESDDKLFLNAEELSNLVYEKRTESKRTKIYIDLPTTILNLPSSNELISTERNNDELLLRLRKLWSRWGKWSECSVTCGEGTISRRRLCVSGRCAPGEFEEQRRPCRRPPCCFDTGDDVHERD